MIPPGCPRRKRSWGVPLTACTANTMASHTASIARELPTAINPSRHLRCLLDITLSLRYTANQLREI